MIKKENWKRHEVDPEDEVYLGVMIGSYYSNDDPEITVVPGLLNCGLKTKVKYVPEKYAKLAGDYRFKPALAHLYLRANFCAPGYSREQYRAEMKELFEHESALGRDN